MELPNGCVVELPEEGPLVDEFGVRDPAVAERKLEAVELPDFCPLIASPSRRRVGPCMEAQIFL